MRFVAYAGRSMNPTLIEPELVEVVPYGDDRVAAGDVVLFTCPSSGKAVIHRVTLSTGAGIHTRGDNNPRADLDLLAPADIQGRVVAAWRGQRRRTIHGGVPGRLWTRWLPVRRAAGRALAWLLRRPYHILATSGALARVLPQPLRPRVVRYGGRARHPMQLQFKGRIIGHYDAARQRWIVRRPYGLLVDVEKLPSQTSNVTLPRVTRLDR